MGDLSIAQIGARRKARHLPGGQQLRGSHAQRHCPRDEARRHRKAPAGPVPPGTERPKAGKDIGDVDKGLGMTGQETATQHHAGQRR